MINYGNLNVALGNIKAFIEKKYITHQYLETYNKILCITIRKS